MNRRTLGLEAGTRVGLILRRDADVTDDLHMTNNYHKTRFVYLHDVPHLSPADVLALESRPVLVIY